MTVDTNMYALALYEAGLTTNPLEYLDELVMFSDLVSADKQLEDFFYKTYDSFDLVKDLLLKSFTKPFINFLSILYKSRNLKNIKSIKDKYEALLMENGLLSIVNIYSTQLVNEEVKAKLINMISGKYPEPFTVKTHIDESILGGYIVKVNGDIYDTSLRSKLNQIKKLGGVENE